MADVRFLDGPLKGQIRTVSEWSDGSPRGVVRAPVDRIEVCGLWFGAKPDSDSVEYRVKPSHYQDGPRWVAAVGQYVGDLVVVAVPHAADLPQDWLSCVLTGAAADELTLRCRVNGLMPGEIREVFRGSLARAKQLAAYPPLHHPIASVAEERGESSVPAGRLVYAAGVLAGLNDAPLMQVSVWQAIAEEP